MKRIIILFLIITFFTNGFAQKYHNFKVSVYCTAFDVDRMSDTTNYLLPVWKEISRQMKIDKVYIETHRDMFMVDQAKLDKVKKFFTNRGIEIAGGITYTIKEADHFRTFCYNDPDDRKKVKEIAE